MSQAETRSVVLVNPVYPPTQAALEQSYTVHKLWEAKDKAAFLKEVSGEVTGLVTDGGSGASAELLQQLPNVRVVSVFGVGVDAVDLDHCKTQGIRVGNTPDVLTDDVADIAVALALGTYRQVAALHNYACAGRWVTEGPAPLTTRFSGSRVGIFGLGRIGGAIAKRLLGFGCHISYCNRKPAANQPYQYYADLETLAANVECLILAVAPTPSMKGIVGDKVLNALGPNGFLVNVSRGLVVDEDALVKALQQERIAGAGLDVFAAEPAIPEALCSMPNVLLQPHVASATEQTRGAMGQLVLDNLENFYAGQELRAFVA